LLLACLLTLCPTFLYCIFLALINETYKQQPQRNAAKENWQLLLALFYYDAIAQRAPFKQITSRLFAVPAEAAAAKITLFF